MYKHVSTIGGSGNSKSRCFAQIVHLAPPIVAAAAQRLQQRCPWHSLAAAPIQRTLHTAASVLVLFSS